MFNSYYEKIGEKTICIDDELPFTIPSSWRWVRLNWIAKFASGKTPSMGNRNYYGNYIPWITSKDMKLKYIAESQIKLSSLGAEQMQIFDPQTLLLVTRSGILRHSIPIAILHNYATINQDLKAITLYYADLAEYIYLCIKGFEKFILTNYTKSGTTVESLVFERFQKILIPLPPEKEARLITERCDTLIKHIDKLSANYVSLKENIEILKYRILDIFFGENCRYKSYYTEKPLKEIAKIVFGQSPDGSTVIATHTKDSIEFHQGKTAFGKYYLDESNRWCVEPTKITNGNSIVMSVRAPVGDVNICKRVICIGRGLCSIEPYSTINEKYLFYLLLSKKHYLESKSTGSTFSAINSKTVKEMRITICEDNLQGKIVEEIEKAFSLLDEIIAS